MPVVRGDTRSFNASAIDPPSSSFPPAFSSLGDSEFVDFGAGMSLESAVPDFFRPSAFTQLLSGPESRLHPSPDDVINSAEEVFWEEASSSLSLSEEISPDFDEGLPRLLLGWSPW